MRGFGHKGVVPEDEDMMSVFLSPRQGQILHFHFIMAFWQYGFFNQQIRTLFIHRCILKGTIETAISIELTQSNIHEYGISGGGAAGGDLKLYT